MNISLIRYILRFFDYSSELGGGCLRDELINVGCLIVVFDSCIGYIGIDKNNINN